MWLSPPGGNDADNIKTHRIGYVQHVFIYETDNIEPHHVIIVGFIKFNAQRVQKNSRRSRKRNAMLALIG